MLWGDGAVVAVPPVDHVPGVFGVPQNAVDGLRGPATSPGGYRVAGGVGVQPGRDCRQPEFAGHPPGENLGNYGCFGRVEDGVLEFGGRRT